jgi:hypothetical protein
MTHPVRNRFPDVVFPRPTRLRKDGQTIRASMAFHRMSLAKVMVNIHPAHQNAPARLPVWRMAGLALIQVSRIASL